MEVVEFIIGGTCTGTAESDDVGSTVKGKSPEVQTVSPSPPAPETFEWVQHGDASARRRARAHVTRGFRRQKAEAAKLERARSLSSEAQSGDGVEASPTPPKEEVEGAAPKAEDAVLARTIGSGTHDPFDSLPFTLDAREQAVLTHFLVGFTPSSYSRDSTSNFHPVKELSLKIGLIDASAFHVIMAIGANDMDVIRGKADSEMTLRHRGMGIKLVNKRLLNSDTSDMSIAGIGLLAGNELLFGTVRNFDTHMRGLAQILKLRGGLESFRESNPALFAWIHWIDYSGSANFLRRRRLLPDDQPTSAGLCSNPYGCPADLLGSLPAGYDMFEFVTKTFQQYEGMVSFMHSPNSEPKNQELSLFMQHIDKDLYSSISLPNIKGNRGRREYIRQCLLILSLTCGAVFVRADMSKGDVLFSRLHKVLNGEAKQCLEKFLDLCRALLKGARLDEQGLHDRVAEILDICGLWEWEEWQSLQEILLDFFLNDEVCAGPLQTLWKRRMEKN